MPANKKYLTKSPLQRWLKITAGFFGGYAVVISLSLFFASFVERQYVLVTGTVLGYVLWAVLLLLAFLAKSGWKIWLIYLSLAVLFALPYLLTA
ncbi:hypothetical protein [Parapedobacter koreensis]|uniref:Iron uptake protein n=1 Tax=Parapedobacter koreensis TaxID=332977 RepID=A0A1H7NRP5_9SPHI|nr:hypothetical protein [Parapedobacter koreensis]SEL26203.1 hypothetical protein SAMN05421740_10482 [Parapedobacter koreensis]